MQPSLTIIKIILTISIIVSIGTAIGATIYFGVLKNNPPVAIQPTPIITSPTTPTITPIIDCPIEVKDIDNNIYKTVQIGSQCWMKENLKVTKNPQGEAITRYCYDNDPSICATDGGLYDWNAAMNNSTQEGGQGICPNGWHIPKDSEWYVLESGLATDACNADRNGSGCYPAGTALRSGGGSGFEVIPAGRYSYINSNSVARGTLALFWTSTENKTLVWRRSVYSSYTSDDLAQFKGKINRGSASKTLGFSLRCLKN